MFVRIRNHIVNVSKYIHFYYRLDCTIYGVIVSGNKEIIFSAHDIDEVQKVFNYLVKLIGAKE